MLGIALFSTLVTAAFSAVQEPRFERRELSLQFHCEGASFADLDHDGHADIVSGPYWYAGPDFAARLEIYAPHPFDPLGYSDNFFAFPHDFDGDGWLDVFFVGFPGQAAFWFRNPGTDTRGHGHWERSLAVPVVDNESPAFTDLTGDGVPELVFHTGGRLGWAAYDPAAARREWVFHPLSADLGLPNFVHGLGVGDIDGDRRADVLLKDGWWKQPASLAGDPAWEFTAFSFAPAPHHGGAQMLVDDVDGDGDNDVITSKSAHAYGLSWFEQVREKGERSFREHVILGATPAENARGLCFSEMHALALADVNGDGARDIVTGKRWWAHGPHGTPGAEDPSVLYWFERARSKDGVDWIPHRIDSDSGVGVQVVAGDIDGDRRVDVVVGNKKGTFVFLQSATAAPESAVAPGILPVGADGARLNLDFETGDLTDWTAEGAAFAGQPVRGDAIRARGREPSLHQATFWIGGYELAGDAPQGTLTSASFQVTHPFASFLLGGGAYERVRIELAVLEDPEPNVVFKTSALDFESMQRVVVDLSEHMGKRMFVRLVDEQDWSWGHVNFDDFRFHTEKPVFAVPDGVPELFPYDPVMHAGLAPEEAAKAMTVPPGFRVELLAAEPELHQPVALAIDPKGRIWIAEAFSYPQRQPEGQGRDTILVFEDADGDGTLERRTVFAEGLNLVSGLEVGFGGVWVGAAPYLLFIPDRDGDLVPDGKPEILLDGFGYQDTHETLNAFNWGPDGWLYGCHGVFTHSRVGKPGTPDGEREPVNAAVWRFHPQRREFEVFAWGTSNPWGVDWNDDGQCFITACVIPHLYHVIQGARYERQGGVHFGAHVYDDIETIADHRHYLGGNPHGANLRSNSAGGGHAHCGALIYLGTRFPAEYRNTIFMGNIHGNRFNNDGLVRSGSGFVGTHREDFLLANDKWFRGINLRSGPDGSVYFIDWYDKQACHLTEPEVWDRTNGRLYRVTYGDVRPMRVDLTKASDLELARLQLSDDEWHVRRARVLLQERGAEAGTIAFLEDAFRTQADPRKKLRAMWALHAVGERSPKLLREALAGSHEYVTAWAIQLGLEDHEVSSDELLALERLSQSSPVVRLYLAAALQRLSVDLRWKLAESLTSHAEDADDHNLPDMLWYGIEPLVAADPERALALAEHARIDLVARFIVRRASAEPSCQEAVVRRLAADKDLVRRAWMLEELATALVDQRDVVAPPSWPALFGMLVKDPDPSARERALSLAVAFGDARVFPELRAIAADTTRTTEQRLQSLDALVRGKDAAAVPILVASLAEPALRGPALRALASFDAKSVPAEILARYGSFTIEERRDALNALVARPISALALLAAVDQGRVPRSDLGAFVLRVLAQHKDPALDAAIAKTIGLVRDSSAEASMKIAALKAVLTRAALAGADLPRGREVFQRTCMQCHTLFGSGGTLAPDLTGSNRADLDYLLSNVLDPSAVVAREYQATVAWLEDGRIVTGIEKKRTDSTVTLQTENETLVLALDELEDIQLQPISTMPEGLLDGLAGSEVRDLVAYLASPQQVPLAATQTNAGQVFDGATLAGWSGNPLCWRVENGEIVGSTSGLAQNEFLVSELELGDFRLAIEVKLVGDVGNSGIQFRTRPLEGGEVAGYQADIGPDWWGKLYEESGRGLLAEGRGSELVAPGEWNRYEIEAIGHRVVLRLNGKTSVELDDPDGALRGQCALQIHSGGPTEVRFRDLRLELLSEDGARRDGAR